MSCNKKLPMLALFYRKICMGSEAYCFCIVKNCQCWQKNTLYEGQTWIKVGGVFKSLSESVSFLY